MGLTFTILGCGSSGGVPRLGGDWGDCDPGNPRNRRRRCSMLVERSTDQGTTRVLIDTSPDMREQLLDAGVGTLDAVVYTHSHADHMHGIDDLRQIVFNMRARVPVWADAPTQAALRARFGYAFAQEDGSAYPPILDLHLIDGPVHISGAGGEITLTPFRAEHGEMAALGFRIGPLAYLPDVVAIPSESWQHLANLDCWVLDALRRKPHPTHAHLALALEWIARAAPIRAVLTNMHVDLDYDTLCAELPQGVIPAHDGLQISYPD
ncbi:MAG: MBL fold metallo-hydrolase [Rhodobacteraceae bacterium]|jgi:phosphoribosyl 1,2-cyclic phosphate phosphodiesterase|nr:MBL fold metallo-hydrolase [Paracoccaceae bacterium]